MPVRTLSPILIPDIGFLEPSSRRTVAVEGKQEWSPAVSSVSEFVSNVVRVPSDPDVVFVMSLQPSGPWPNDVEAPVVSWKDGLPIGRKELWSKELLSPQMVILEI